MSILFRYLMWIGKMPYDTLCLFRFNYKKQMSLFPILYAPFSLSHQPESIQDSPPSLL